MQAIYKWHTAYVMIKKKVSVHIVLCLYNIYKDLSPYKLFTTT